MHTILFSQFSQKNSHAFPGFLKLRSDSFKMHNFDQSSSLHSYRTQAKMRSNLKVCMSVTDSLTHIKCVET